MQIMFKVNNKDTRTASMTSLKFFKGCLSQILFGLFLNTLPHIRNYENK